MAPKSINMTIARSKTMKLTHVSIKNNNSQFFRIYTLYSLYLTRSFLCSNFLYHNILAIWHHLALIQLFVSSNKYYKDVICSISFSIDPSSMGHIALSLSRTVLYLACTCLTNLLPSWIYSPTHIHSFQKWCLRTIRSPNYYTKISKRSTFWTRNSSYSKISLYFISSWLGFKTKR